MTPPFLIIIRAAKRLTRIAIKKLNPPLSTIERFDNF